jgi:hypothetical protein
VPAGERVGETDAALAERERHGVDRDDHAAEPDGGLGGLGENGGVRREVANRGHHPPGGWPVDGVLPDDKNAAPGERGDGARPVLRRAGRGFDPYLPP